MSSNIRSKTLFLVATCLFSSNWGNASIAQEITLKLWPGAAPHETGEFGPETIIPNRPGGKQALRITQVVEPTLSVFRPSKAADTGCAVVICPGGAYRHLAFDLEGTEIAKWFNTIGVTAIVLKYRVPRRSETEIQPAPLSDVQRAIRIARSNAKKWGIDSQRIGVMGFSAGGHLAVMAATHWDRPTYDRIDETDEIDCRPNFLIPVYPAYLVDRKDSSRLVDDVRVTEQTPPSFIVVAEDDADRAVGAALLFIALKKAKVVSELHIYSKGGHGYGLRPSELPVSSWPRRCHDWMKTSGLLEHH